MYQNNELKHLYERLKARYPQCGLEFSRNHLTLTRPYTRIEIDRDGVELYVNEQLYDRFSSEEVDDPDDLYELLEAFLLDLQHAGMEKGNQLYRDTRDQAARKGSRLLILMALVLTAVLLAFLWSRGLWLMLPILVIPTASLLLLKQVRTAVFRERWVCPSCGTPLPLVQKFFSVEMDYVFRCPHCGRVLEQAPNLEAVQREYAPAKPLEPSRDLPLPGKRWPCLLAGSVSMAFALTLLPLIFIPDGNEPLDMVGVGVGVAMILLILAFGLMLLLCRHTEPEETRQPVVIVRERTLVTGFGMVLWAVGFVLLLMGIIVAGTPPFEPGVTAFVAVPGLLLLLLGVWMLLAGRNRTLFVFQDQSIWYISSWGKRREFAPGQVASLRMTVNRSIHLLDSNGKKLASVETNMRGIPRFAEWIESTDLDFGLTTAMEQQAQREEAAEGMVQWREEYRTPLHSHLGAIRIGLRLTVLLYALGGILPIPLYLFADAKFRTVMTIAALAPIPFLLCCLAFAPVMWFGDPPKNPTPEWEAMHIKVPFLTVMLISLLYLWQVNHIWDGFVLQEADVGISSLLQILGMATALIVLLVLRAPKRLRLGAGLFMGILGFSIAVSQQYCINAALSGTPRHYPAVIVDRHADDPEVDDDGYTLTVVMDNGEKAELSVPDLLFDMAERGEPLEVCHRESPFGVVFLDIHLTESEGENTLTRSDFRQDTTRTSMPVSSGKLLNLDLEPVIAYGRLRALFGEPNYETENVEDAYSYLLVVEPESSDPIYLEVYEGSSGPAIGGQNDAASLRAAEALKQLIEESDEVADYQYEGIYQDLDVKISMGIQDGVPYYHEEPMGGPTA